MSTVMPTTPASEIPPVLHTYVISVPAELPTPPDGYRLTRLAVLLDDHNADVHFELVQLRRAADHWVEFGYRRQGLFALAVYDHPVLDLAEVYCEWGEAGWQAWRAQPYAGSPLAPTATEIEAHQADLEAQRGVPWTAQQIIEREG